MKFFPNGKLNKTVAQSADVTEASVTTAVDIPGLTIDLPRAGTYLVTAVLPWTAGDATSRSLGCGVAFSGSATLLSAWVFFGTASNFSAYQTTAGTLAATSQTATSGRQIYQGMIKVSSAGTLKMQFSRTAASITHTSGVLSVKEA